MSRTNLKEKLPQLHTHGGGEAVRVPVEDQLKRTLLACMLWEDEFYESGMTVAERIKELAPHCKTEFLAKLAIQARHDNKLRHAPLLILLELIKRGGKIASDTIYHVVSRPDELGELVSMYWADKSNRKMLPASMKRGLARAFGKFDEYQLAKWDKEGAAIKLKDVMFLAHPKPGGKEQEALFKRVAEGKLKTPETHESRAAGGMGKKENFTDLMNRGKLGYMALLKNLRGMLEAGVDPDLIKRTVLARKGADRVLPFRFISAARHAPKLEGVLDEAMVAAFQQRPKLPGKTVVIVDVSGSMSARLSGKSEMSRANAACALAAILRELCEEPAIYATAGSDARRIHQTKLVPSRHGMALADAIWGMCHPLGGGGIFLNQVSKYIKEQEGSADRTIVITDEQDCSIGSADSPKLAEPLGAGYMLNVASAQNGIGYGKWVHIDGFSESCIEFIQEYESQYH